MCWIRVRLIFEFEVIDVLDPHYKMVNSEELIDKINNNAVALDIRLENQWDKGVIEGTFQETAFNKDGKFNVYIMDKVRALAAEESQNIEIVFISHDGETAAILGNAFAEDLGFKNVSVLKGGILQWLNEDRKLVPHKKNK